MIRGFEELKTYLFLIPIYVLQYIHIVDSTASCAIHLSIVSNKVSEKDLTKTNNIRQFLLK